MVPSLICSCEYVSSWVVEDMLLYSKRSQACDLVMLEIRTSSMRPRKFVVTLFLPIQKPLKELDDDVAFVELEA